jgi:hypothetical protein
MLNDVAVTGNGEPRHRSRAAEGGRVGEVPRSIRVQLTEDARSTENGNTLAE